MLKFLIGVEFVDISNKTSPLFDAVRNLANRVREVDRPFVMHNSYFMWKIEKLTDHLIKSAHDMFYVIESKVFYTSEYGYCMRLHAHFKGHGTYNLFIFHILSI